ncbi:conserved hypothetical protein [Pseudomonas veronii]|uniref:GIY-YIG nuclease family protein n=1 Tax=Pseudomonas veronii TaxID=76761 RepID=UPI00175C4380|nr:GIY-YIG nuclease family protein [Pseudomonas veronii]CAD0264229.1 conserved hypothetical protein [Pseudomonas veronii]
MPDFYYTIKARTLSDNHGGDSPWAWPPVFSGLVVADDRKIARAMIEEEYGRAFPVRVLQKDLDQHHYLLGMKELGEHDEYIRSRFRETACLECSAVFRLIDKYNDAYCDYKGPNYCSAKCHQAGKARDVSELKLASQGLVPAVIYCVMQKSTGKAYVGQTIRPFTLRWWEHLTYPGECKFHKALELAGVTDFAFSVLEVVRFPIDCPSKSAYLNDRERHWVDTLNAVAEGFNSVRPAGINPQQSLEMCLADT